MADQNKDDKGKITVEEAGRKGGETTPSTHGREFYSEIGKKGGESRGEKHDRDTDAEASMDDEGMEA